MSAIASRGMRIKAILILRRNAARDYLDFVALASALGDAGTADALRPFDRLCQDG